MEDLSPFFDGLDAQPIMLALTGGSVTITGYFDNAFFGPHIGETILEGTQPRATCRYSDVANVPRETIATIAGVAYSVIEVQPEGTGLATLILALEPNTLT